MISFPKPDVEQFLRSFSITDFAVSPDEKQIVFSTNLSGKYNLWAMNPPNNFPHQLTFKDQSSQGLIFDKKGRFIIVGFDHDGDENTQLYALPPQGGVLKEVVHHKGARNGMPFLSKDGERLFFTSSKDNETFLNVYSLNLATGEEEVVLEGKESATYLVGLSPNESDFLYLKTFSNTFQLLYAKFGDEHIPLTPSTEEEHTAGNGLFVSESIVYLLTNYGADFSYLASFDLQTKEFTKLKELPNEDFSSLKYDRENNILYIHSEKGVEDHLYQYHLKDNSWEEIQLPCSVVEKTVVVDSGTLYLLGRSATKPLNLYKRVEDEWVALTNYQIPGVNADQLVEPDVITYKSFDGLEIESLFFKAKPENDKGEIIFWPHGGPQSAERKQFRAMFQSFLYEGYSVFAPNFRGSTGYGLAFMKMVEGDWGEGPRLDNVAALDWLIENGYAQKGNIYLVGGSYGGYMSLLLHGRHAEYFKAVIDIFGPSDLFSFIDSVPEHWKPIMDQWVGNPEKDRDKLIEFSPITYLDGMTKPMLGIQGANDPRVVQAESDKIVDALRKLGREVEYMVLEDEGHGFSKKENEIAVSRKMLEFMGKYNNVNINA